jgi:lambda family phage tail tape measure protein
VAEETGGDVILTAGLDTRPVLTQARQLKAQLEQEFGSVRVGLNAAMGGGGAPRAGGAGGSTAARAATTRQAGMSFADTQKVNQDYYNNLLGVQQRVAGQAKNAAAALRDAAEKDAAILANTAQASQEHWNKILGVTAARSGAAQQSANVLRTALERDEAMIKSAANRAQSDYDRLLGVNRPAAPSARASASVFQDRFREEAEGERRVAAMERERAATQATADNEATRAAQARTRMVENSQRLQEGYVRQLAAAQATADREAEAAIRRRVSLIESSQRLAERFARQLATTSRATILGQGSAENRLSNLQLRAERNIPPPTIAQRLMGAPSGAENIARIMGPARTAVEAYNRALAETGPYSERTARAQVAMREAFTVTSSAIARQGGLMRSLGGIQGTLNGLGGTISRLGGTWDRFIFNSKVALQALVAFGGFREIYNMITAQQRLDAVLSAVSHSQADQSSSMMQMRRVAEETGFGITELGKDYGQFLIAATRGGETLFAAQNQFELLAKSARNMGLSTADLGGVINALQQMFSKGSIQAEELRGQLGDRIPVAMEAARRAVEIVDGKVGNLEAMMKAGQLTTTKYAGALIEQMYLMTGGADTFQKSSETLAAGIGRLGNALLDATMKMNEGGFGAAVVEVTDKLSIFLRSAEGGAAFREMGAAVKFLADNVNILALAIGSVVALNMAVWVRATIVALWPLLAIVGALATGFAIMSGALQLVDKGFGLAGTSIKEVTEAGSKGLETIAGVKMPDWLKDLPNTLEHPLDAMGSAMDAFNKKFGGLASETEQVQQIMNNSATDLGQVGQAISDAMKTMDVGKLDPNKVSDALMDAIPTDVGTKMFRQLQQDLADVEIRIRVGVNDKDALAALQDLKSNIEATMDPLGKSLTKRVNTEYKAPPPKTDTTAANRQKRIDELFRQQDLEARQRNAMVGAMRGALSADDFGGAVSGLARLNDQQKIALELEKKNNDLTTKGEQARLRRNLTQEITGQRSIKILQDELKMQEDLLVAQTKIETAGMRPQERDVAVGMRQQDISLRVEGLNPGDREYDSSMDLKRRQMLKDQEAERAVYAADAQRDLRDQITLSQERLDIAGQTNDAQELANALNEKSIELYNKGFTSLDGQFQVTMDLVRQQVLEKQNADAVNNALTERKGLLDDIYHSMLQTSHIGQNALSSARSNAEDQKRLELLRDNRDITLDYNKALIESAGKAAEASTSFDTLNNAFQSGQTPLEKAQQQLEELQQALEKFGDQMDATARNKVDRALGDMQRRTEGFTGGMKQGFVEMSRQADDLFDIGHQVFTDAISGMSDALFAFVKTGKLSFQELALSMIDYIIKIMIQIAVLKTVSAAFGFFGGGTGPAALPGAGTAGVGYAGMNIPSGMPGNGLYRAGGVVEPMRAFAQGGMIRGPTPLMTSKGPAIAGESGPEVAIAPLARTASGDLGVRVVGGSPDTGSSGGGGTQVNFGDIHVTVQGGSNGNSADDAKLARRIGAEMHSTLRQIAQEEIAKAAGPGGQLRKPR